MSKTYDKRRIKTSYDANTPWWKLPRGEHCVAERLVNLVSATDIYHQNRLKTASLAYWMYERDSFDFLGYPKFLDEFSTKQWGANWRKKAPTSNEVKKSVDAAVSFLMDRIPRLQIRCDNAPYELRQVIEERELALDSTINSDKAHQTWREFGADGLLCGQGWVRPVITEDRLTYRKLEPDQIWFDPLDQHNMQVAVGELWDRDQFLDWFEGLESEYCGFNKQKHQLKIEEISKINSCKSGNYFYNDSDFESPKKFRIKESSIKRASDQILVAHIWRASTTEQEENANGRYACLVAGDGFSDPILVVDAPYLRRGLPVVHWSPYPAPSGGLDGQGFAQALAGYQHALDHSNYVIQDTIEKLGYHKIIDPTGPSDTKTREAMVAQKVVFVPVPGMQPQVLPSNSLPTDHYTWTKEMRDRAAQDTGLGQIVTYGQTSLGANASGIAQVQEAQRQTDRMANVVNRWRFAHKRGGEISLELIEDSLASDRDFQANFTDKDGSWQSKKWSQLHRLNEDYHVEIEPRGALGDTAAARIQNAIELSGMGILPQEMAKDILLSSPDLRAAKTLENAPRRLIDVQIAELINPDGDHEFGMAISEDQDLNLLIDIATKQINLAILKRASIETVNRLRAYKATAVNKLPAPPAPTPEMDPNMMPQV